MDYITSRSVEETLGKTQAYFATEWPFGGRYRREGSEVICAIQEPEGCLRHLLDILTIGSMPPPPTHETKLIAYPTEGHTMLTITASKPEHAEALAQWASEQLDAKTS